MHRVISRTTVTALAGAALIGALAAPAAQGAVLATPKCVRYVPAFKGKRYMPARGAGFIPGSGIVLRWSEGSVAGLVPIAANGAFGPVRLAGPKKLERRHKRMQRYRLTATTPAAPFVAATKRVRFVRVGIVVRPRGHDLKRKVRFHLYGFPSGKKIYAHYVYKGKRRARTFMGRASKRCGTLRSKRKTFLPTRARLGKWKIYFTAGKRYSKKRRYPVHYKFKVVRRRARGSSAAAAAVAAGGTAAAAVASRADLVQAGVRRR